MLLMVLFLLTILTEGLPVWNEHVNSAHALARDAFKCWITSGKARQGTEYEEM